jgi:NAD(P)-dependent dehydrogenase (short-subunit alcohol dehydrogenase family)
MRKSNELAGTTCVITGGGGFLAREHAVALLSLGAGVALWDIDEVSLQNQVRNLQLEFPASNVYSQKVDITSEDEVIHGLSVLLSKGFQLSILINNAAINHIPEKLKNSDSRPENFPVEAWRREIEVGLTGAFICSKILGRYFIENKKGTIINISSDLSVIAPDQRLYEKPNLNENEQPMKPISYSVNKTALLGLTRYLSTSWASFGIRVNAISPGGVFNGQAREFVDKIEDRIPLGRMAHKEEYRAAVQFLATEDSSYMTGQNLVIDGGRSVW